MASIYKKTAKGQSEIETRAHRLAPRLRAALIMVDGRRTDGELQSMIQPEADAVLAGLLEQGYIELAASAPASRSAAPAEPAEPEPSRKLDDIRRGAVRFLTDNLGPMADSLAVKIERAKDWNELKAHLEVAEHLLHAGRGIAQAKEFNSKFIEPPAA